jgi:hypothetical protein
VKQKYGVISVQDHFCALILAAGMFAVSELPALLNEFGHG